MARQSYHNHVRWYVPHHFVFYPITFVMFALSIYFSFTRPETMVWIFISILFFMLFFLAYMLRQHYGLTLQNRIVKVELRNRYFRLTGKRFEEIEHKLHNSQIFALRFASDKELIALIERALDEKLSSSRIKKSIVHWRGDYQRV